MILQSKGGCYLTEAADVKIEQRHFVTTVFLVNPSDAGKWREVTEAETRRRGDDEVTAARAQGG